MKSIMFFSIFGNLMFKNFMGKGHSKFLFDLIPFFLLPSCKSSPKQIFDFFGKNLKKSDIEFHNIYLINQIYSH